MPDRLPPETCAQCERQQTAHPLASLCRECFERVPVQTPGEWAAARERQCADLRRAVGR